MRKITSWIVPAAVGIIGGIILSFTLLGGVSSGTAADQEKKAAANATIAALTPICVEAIKGDADALAKVEEAGAGYKRRAAVKDTGLADFADVNSGLLSKIHAACGEAAVEG